jgi:hypothetical protein
MNRGENGQALPLAILALAIGSLVVAPFLGQASASLIGSRTYGQGQAELYACDAGIEHAIWGLAYGELADSFTGPGDQLSYQLDEEINSLEMTVTITANATAGGPAGNIQDTIIDSLMFDGSSASDPSIVHVSGNIYAIAYQGPSGDGFVKTVTIDAEGQIGNSVIDTLEFDTSNGATPKIVSVSGNIYAIAYQGSNGGYLKTESIDANGQISNSVIDTLQFDNSNGAMPDIIFVSGTTFAITYQGRGFYFGSPGYVKTVSIAANGQIGNYTLDSLTFENNQCTAPDLIHVSGDTYAVAYQSSAWFSYYGELKTMTISANGQIGNYVIDSLEFDSYQGASPSIVPVSGDIYAIACQGSGNGGFVKTVSIATNGNIGNSVIASYEFDTADGYEPSIVCVAGGIYAVAYRGPSNDGFVKTISIGPTGAIGSTIDTLEFDTADGYTPDIINVSDDVFAITYRGSSSRGYIKTIDIAAGQTVAAYEILASAGSRSIRAFVNIDGAAASVVSWRIQ